jgi:hypothetical protein
VKVKELIELLQKCNPEDIVMYDASNAMWNEHQGVWCSDPEGSMEATYGVDDVLIGSGTLRGFVYLTEDKLEDMTGDE